MEKSILMLPDFLVWWYVTENSYHRYSCFYRL